MNYEISESKEIAYLAGGCFWGMEELFRQLPGILETKVGYTGGNLNNPTYEDVKTGKTNHAEAIKVIFDPTKISYAEILKFFFKIHDPTTLNRQGNDIGDAYRSAIFFINEEQKQTANHAIKIAQTKWPNKIVTSLEPFDKFYDAEEYHQKYLEKNPGGYTCHFIRK